MHIWKDFFSIKKAAEDEHCAGRQFDMLDLVEQKKNGPNSNQFSFVIYFLYSLEDWVK